MNGNNLRIAIGSIVVATAALFTACGGGGDRGGGFAGVAALQGAAAPAPAPAPAPAGNTGAVKITVTGPNAVSQWNEIATNTINVPATTTGSAAEQRPTDAVDLASVHIAIYDALVAITGRYRPFAVTASSPGDPVSQEAAVAAAAYGVLKGLFPNRAAQYQAAYDSFIGALPNDAARASGIVLGAQVAEGVLAQRSNDGRSVVLAAYVPGTAPGQFRGVNPVNRYYPSIKPFTLESASQFRLPAPPALASAEYATDFNETRLLGVATGSTRTDAQTETARFHTEPPPRFWPRNLRRFAMTDRSLTEHARLLAMLFVSEADAVIACFESKYFYEFWRPTSAITLADTDGNAATTADPAWTPVVPTPNHPEYPAAHACVASAVAETLKTYYGTGSVDFIFDSTVTGSTHSFTSTQAFVEEVRGARIYGGMHFRNSMLKGEELGVNVARWVAQKAFQPR